MTFGGKAKVAPGLAGDGEEDAQEPESLSFFGRNRSKGKGRDGGGEYEMVGMNESHDGNV